MFISVADGFSASVPRGSRGRRRANALKLVKERNFDLIVLEVHPPGMSGLEVCRRIKEYAPGTAQAECCFC